MADADSLRARAPLGNGRHTGAVCLAASASADLVGLSVLLLKCSFLRPKEYVTRHKLLHPLHPATALGTVRGMELPIKTGLMLSHSVEYEQEHRCAFMTHLPPRSK